MKKLKVGLAVLFLFSLKIYAVEKEPQGEIIRLPENIALALLSDFPNGLEMAAAENIYEGQKEIAKFYNSLWNLIYLLALDEVSEDEKESFRQNYPVTSFGIQAYFSKEGMRVFSYRQGERFGPLNIRELNSSRFDPPKNELITITQILKQNTSKSTENQILAGLRYSLQVGIRTRDKVRPLRITEMTYDARKPFDYGEKRNLQE